MRSTGGRGVDVVVEMAAHVNLERDLTLLAKHGRIVVVGSRGRIEIDPRQAMGRDAAILGMTLFNVTPADLSDDSRRARGGSRKRRAPPRRRPRAAPG